MLIPVRVLVEAYEREGFERTDDGSDQTLTFRSGDDMTFHVVDTFDGEIEAAFVIEHIRLATLTEGVTDRILQHLVDILEEQGLSPPPS